MTPIRSSTTGFIRARTRRSSASPTTGRASGPRRPWATMISPTFFISATHDNPGAARSHLLPGQQRLRDHYIGTVGGGSAIRARDV